VSSLEAFDILDVRAGTVLSADVLPGARKPAYRLRIDFGPEIGTKQSSAQITVRYRPEDLIGSQVLGVVNLPPKRVAGFYQRGARAGRSGRERRGDSRAPRQTEPQRREALLAARTFLSHGDGFFP